MRNVAASVPPTADAPIRMSEATSFVFTASTAEAEHVAVAAQGCASMPCRSCCAISPTVSPAAKRATDVPPTTNPATASPDPAPFGAGAPAPARPVYPAPAGEHVGAGSIPRPQDERGRALSEGAQPGRTVDPYGRRA